MVRAACIDKNGLKKGAWSEEEDEILRSYVVRHGHSNWRLVPKNAGLNRCGKSCRLRWMNYLKPGVKRGGYTEEEKYLIKKLHGELGNKWSAIAAELPGRTDNEIKNFWHTHFDKRGNRTYKSSGKQPQAKTLPESSSQTSRIITPKSSKVIQSGLKQEISEDVYILDSSSRSSNSGVSANWELDSFVDQSWPELLPEPSDSGSSSDSFSGFQESFVVDTSYIQELVDFSYLDDCGIYCNLGYDENDDMMLF